VGDEDGIVVVPLEEAEAVLKAVRALKQKHDSADHVYARGELAGMEEIEAWMRAAGCEFI
jgi:regulator of RNase E activity RraA